MSATGRLTGGDRLRDTPRLQLHLVRRRLPVRKLLQLMQLLQLLLGLLALTGGLWMVSRRPLRTGTPDAVPPSDLRVDEKQRAIISRNGRAMVWVALHHSGAVRSTTISGSWIRNEES